MRHSLISGDCTGGSGAGPNSPQLTHIDSEDLDLDSEDLDLVALCAFAEIGTVILVFALPKRTVPLSGDHAVESSAPPGVERACCVRHRAIWNERWILQFSPVPATKTEEAWRGPLLRGSGCAKWSSGYTKQKCQERCFCPNKKEETR
jgi:hypothetical protein